MTKKILFLLMAFVFLLAGTVAMAETESPIAISNVYYDAAEGTYHATVTGTDASKATLLIVSGELAGLEADATTGYVTGIKYLDQATLSGTTKEFVFAIDPSVTGALTIYANTDKDSSASFSIDAYADGMEGGETATAVEVVTGLTKFKYEKGEELESVEINVTYTNGYELRNVMTKPTLLNGASMATGGVKSAQVIYDGFESDVTYNDIYVNGSLDETEQPTITPGTGDSDIEVEADIQIQYDAENHVFYVLPTTVTTKPAGAGEGAAGTTEKVLAWNVGNDAYAPNSSVPSIDGEVKATSIQFDKHVSQKTSIPATLRMTSDKQGVRFSTNYNKTVLDSLNSAGITNVEYGAIIARKSTLEGLSITGDTITSSQMQSVIGQNKVAKYANPAKVAQISGNLYQYNYVITMTEEAHYVEDFVCIGYIKYSIDGAGEYYVFSDEHAAIANAKQIANALNEEDTNDLTQGAQDWLEEVKNASNGGMEE